MEATRTLPDANVRSQTYHIARAAAQCPNCGVSTPVSALALPRGHEALDSDASDAEFGGGDGDYGDDPDNARAGAGERGHWQAVDANALLFYVEKIPDEVQRRLRALSSHFQLSQSPVTHGSYWANHCEHCDALLEDHELHCEPEGAFAPSSDAAAATIELLRFDEPLQAAAAGYALEPAFFAFVRSA